MTTKSTAPRDFGFGEDEAMLRDMARKLLSERLPMDRLRNLVGETPHAVYDDGEPAPWDKALWSEIVDLGWTGLAVGEAEGGSDVSLVGIAGMVEEVGRHALPSPLISTLMAGLVLRAAGGEVADVQRRPLAGRTGEDPARLLDVQRPGRLAVPVVEPVGAVGGLLDFADQRAGHDCMDQPGRHIEEIARA